MKKTFDIIQKIIFITTNIIIIFLLFIWIYYAFQVNVNKVKKEEVFNYNLFLVNTGSMQNAININDIIIVKRTTELKENDIIAFKQDGQLIVHRIIEKRQNEILTKGDANNQSDEHIKHEQVIGKVIKIIPLRNIIQLIIVIVGINIILGVIEKCVLEKGENKE